MKIDIQKLTKGTHTFEFTVSPEQIGVGDQPLDIEKINVRCEVIKADESLVVKKTFSALTQFECDKCLDRFTSDISDVFTLFYTTDNKALENDEEETVRLMTVTTREIDLKDDVRENLLLNIPMRVVCREDCKGLCSNCGTNLNHETCECRPTTIDPRWAALKDVLNQNDNN